MISLLNNDLGGCKLSQEGNNFYITGADAVRKKLGEGTCVYLGQTKSSGVTGKLTAANTGISNFNPSEYSENNFVFNLVKLYARGVSTKEMNVTYDNGVRYNKNTGEYTISPLTAYVDGVGFLAIVYADFYFTTTPLA